jgi:hypothetical protein
MKQLQFFGYGDDTFGGGSTNPADGEFYHDVALPDVRADARLCPFSPQA